MLISKNELVDEELPYTRSDGKTVGALEDTIIDVDRWSIIHEIVFLWKDGKTYRTGYSVGATEHQEERPWEYEDEVECTEVHQVEKLVKVWEPV